MSRLIRVSKGEVGLMMEASADGVELLTATSAASSGLIAGGIDSDASLSPIFSGSVASALCSTINRLRIAPRQATSALTHHGKPSMPFARPVASKSPETLGPIALAKLAEDCATPLKVPLDRLGVALLSIMFVDGKENACAVTFQIRMA